MRKLPEQKPGRSKQDYQTPPEFLAAVKQMLGIKRFWCDLAASKENAVAEWFYTEQDNALVQCWNSEECGFFRPKFGIEWGWLNPPFANIAPWVAKAFKESREGAQIAMLVPASVGANWWAAWVDQEAHALFLNGRLQFVGTDGPYPKDCALLLYTKYVRGGYEVWTWKR